MDFLLMLFSGASNCVILIMTINATVTHNDSNYWVGLILAFIAGFGLGIVRDIRKNNFSFNSSLIKFFASLCLCYLGYKAKLDWNLFPSIGLEWFVVAISFGSLYFVDAADKIFSLGIPKVAQLLLSNLLSYVDKSKARGEDKP